MHPFLLTTYGLGIDLSDGGVKCLLLARRGGKIVVTTWGRGTFPQGAYKNGRIVQQDTVAKTVRTVMHTLTLPHAPVPHVAALSDAQTFFTTVYVPTDTLSQKTIIEEVQKDLPIDLSSMHLDWQRLPSDPAAPTTPVFVMAADQTIIEELTTTLERANVFPDIIESEALAIGRLVGTDGRHAVLDLGKMRATIIALDRDIPAFTLSLPLAGEAITMTIAKTLKLDSKKAEEAKLRCGFDVTACEGSLKEIIQRHIDATAQKIITALEEARGKDGERRPFTELLLTGGGAHLKALDVVLKAHLDIPVVRSSLWKTIEKPDTFPKDELSWTVALGLALRGLL